MDSQQIMEFLLPWQEKMAAETEAIKARTKAIRERMTAEREAIIKETNVKQANAYAQWEVGQRRMAARREKADADWRAW
jgi:hypothetical protein